jgi:hypothetical protein
MVGVKMVKKPLVLMIALYNLQPLIVEMGNVTMVKKLLVLTIVLYNLQPLIVEMGNATMVKKLLVLTIAPLNVLLVKSQMVMVAVFMTARVYLVPLGTIINNAVFVHPNMWIMEMANVFIIMFIMVAATL